MSQLSLRLPRPRAGLRLGLALTALAALSASAQQTVYWRSEAANGSWDSWSNGGHWYYSTWNNSQNRPDLSYQTANYIVFANSVHNSMTLNGVSDYYVNQLIFNAGTGARSFGNDAGQGIEIRNSGAKIENNVALTHTFNVPLELYTGVQFRSIYGELVFNGAIQNNGYWIDVYGNNSAAVTLAGNLQGSGGIAIKEYSLVKLTGASSFTGNVEIDRGEFWIGSSGSMGSGTIFVGNSAQGAETAKLWLQSAGVSLANNITVNAGNDGYRVVGGLNTSGQVTFNGSVTLNGPMVAEAQTGGTVAFSNSIGGTGKLIKRGGGTVSLAGSNNYSGNTEIDDGLLSLSGGINSSSHVYLGNGLNVWSTTLSLSGTDKTINNLTVNSSSGSGTRTVNVTGGAQSIGTLTLNRDATISASGGSLSVGALAMGNNDLTINNSAGAQITGAISATSGAADLNKQGSGTLTISGSNSSSYKLNITQGTVYLNHANALGTAYGDKVNFSGSSSELRIGADIAPASFGMTINNVTATLNVDNGRTFTVGGQIQGAGGTPNVIKSGQGTLVVNAAATYSGTTSINAGTLALGAAGSLASSSLTSVNNGGTLSGIGTVGALAVNSGGLLSPGNSPGTLNAGNTSWGTGGGYVWEINDVDATAGSDPGWDLLNVTGTLTVDATSLNPFTIYITSLTLANSSGLVHDFDTLTSYQWLIATASGGVSGFSADKFALSYSGSFQNPNSGLWSISNLGNNVYLNYTGGEPFAAVPEPSTLVLLLGAGGLIAALRRRIRRFAFAENAA